VSDTHGVMTELILVPFVFIQLELRIFLVGYLMCSCGVLCAITLMCLHPLGQGTFHITANWLSTAIRGSELQAQLFSFFPGLDPVRTFQLGV
jgi:ABC-type arginine/histidine transport system permease subunit